MSIRKIFPLNPMAWLIFFALRAVKVLPKPDDPPDIAYRNEFLIKSPEQTIKDGYANCINLAILRYAYLYRAYWGVKGIIYAKRGREFHSEFAVSNEKVEIVYGMSAKSDNPYTGLFITTEAIYALS